MFRLTARSNRFSQKFLIHAATAALLASGVPAFAQSCMTGKEKLAFDLRALQSEMMLAALQCGKQSEYNIFMRQHKQELQWAHDRIAYHFSRVYGGGGEDQRDHFITDLANAQSQSGDQQGEQFCLRIEQIDRDALSLRGSQDVSDFVFRNRIIDPYSLTLCNDVDAEAPPRIRKVPAPLASAPDGPAAYGGPPTPATFDEPPPYSSTEAAPADDPDADTPIVSEANAEIDPADAERDPAIANSTDPTIIRLRHMLHRLAQEQRGIDTHFRRQRAGVEHPNTSNLRPQRTGMPMGNDESMLHRNGYAGSRHPEPTPAAPYGTAHMPQQTTTLTPRHELPVSRPDGHMPSPYDPPASRPEPRITTAEPDMIETHTPVNGHDKRH